MGSLREYLRNFLNQIVGFLKPFNMKKEIKDLETDVLEKCIEGDFKAYKQLYNYYAPKMKDICVRYARTTFEAEDILQEAFIKVFLNLKYYQPKGSFYHWLRKIVKNTAINHINGDRISRNLIVIDLGEQKQPESTNIINIISANELLAIVDGIPLGYNKVFNLHVIEGYTHPEIADKLNISASSSRSQLFKAKIYLKNVLSNHKVYEYKEDY